MINVLHVVPKISEGGVASVIMNIYDNIDQNKYNFQIITHGDSNFKIISNKYSNLKIYNLKKIREIGLISYYKQLRELLLNIDYDIIHIHTGHLTVLYSLIFNAIKKRKTILHAHTTRVVNKKHQFLHFFLRIATSRVSDLRLSCSKLAGDFCFGFNNYQILHNGIDIEKVIYISKESVDPYVKLIFEKCRNENQLILCSVAAFTKQKNHEFLVKIASTLKSLRFNFALFFAGDGPLKDEIMNLCVLNDLQLNNQVYFLGQRNDIPYILREMDILLLPSFYEGLPVSVIEAQVFNKKCFLSEHIDRDVALSNEVEFLSIKHGVLEWVNKIMTTNPKETRSSNIIDSEYNINKVIPIIEKIYSDLMSKGVK